MRVSAKKSAIILASVLMGAFCCRAQKVVTISEAELARQAVSEAGVRARVDFLCDSLCAGRATGTPGGTEAAFWIARHFAAAGMQAPLLPGGGPSWSRSFRTASGNAGHNIIGIMPGSSRTARSSYVLFMAYFDGLGSLGGKLYPGADSNASGVVAMLGIADMMRSLAKIGKSWNRSVIFVALDAKYAGQGGAPALWNSLSHGDLTDPQSGRRISVGDISLVVNLDQLGSSDVPLHPSRPEYLIALGAEGFVRSALTGVNLRQDIGLDLGFDYYGSSDFTRMFYRGVGDQKVFVEHGIPAVMVTSGITMRNNKTADTPESLDYPLLVRRIWLLFHWIDRIL